MAPSADPMTNDPYGHTGSDPSERIVGAGRATEDHLDWLENQSRGRASGDGRGRGAAFGWTLVSAAGVVAGVLALAA